MSNYIISYSDTANGFITITTGTVDTTTSLKLIGRNYPNFGQPIAENFLHLLENFAGPDQPNPPTTGQLWYNTADPGSKKLKIYDGASWVPSNGVWQGSTDPYTTGAGATNGDIWVDTESQLLKILTDAGWVLVGPTFSNSNRTGSYPAQIVDRDGTTHDVIIMYLNDIAIEIIAKESFTPLTIIDGYTNLVPGLNISTKVFDGAFTKMSGIAASASALRQTSPSIEIVNANNFVRNDIDQSINGSLIINNNTGIKIGKTASTFALLKDGYNANFVNFVDNGTFNFKVVSGVTQPVLLTINGKDKAVGVGENNLAPAATLDVKGTFSATGVVTFLSNLNVGGTISAGGINSSQVVTVNSTTFLKDNVTIGNSIYPTTPYYMYAANTVTSIGTSVTPFRNIYASSIYANQFQGNLVGGASKLTLKSKFTILGQVRTTNLVEFDGNGGVEKQLETELTTDAIRAHPFASQITDTDELLIYSTTSTALARVQKSDFLSDLYSSNVPTGAMMPWAPDTLPTGWAWCDGHAYNQSGPGYFALFEKIGIKYGYQAGSTIDFRVPNLNGGEGSPGPFSLYAGTATYITAWPMGIKYIIKL